MSILQRKLSEDQRNGARAEGLKISRLLGNCAICRSPNLSGHHYTRLATAVVKDKSTNVHLFKLAENGDWESLSRLSTWDHTQDNLEWFVVKCEAEQLQVVTILSPFELYQGDKLLATNRISDPESLKRLGSLLNNATWRPLPDRVG